MDQKTLHGSESDQDGLSFPNCGEDRQRKKKKKSHSATGVTSV